MAPSTEQEGGWLPPFGLKVTLTFADKHEVQEVLNTQFKLVTGEHDIQSFLLEKITEILQKSVQWSGGSQDAVQLHQKLEGLQRLARTGAADLEAAPKACIFLGEEPSKKYEEEGFGEKSQQKVGCTKSDPKSKSERCPAPQRCFKSEEALANHEESDPTRSAKSSRQFQLVATFRKLWHAQQHRKHESSHQDNFQSGKNGAVHVPLLIEEKPNRASRKKSNQTMPTIDEQPEEVPSTTDDSDADVDSEGSDDFGPMDFAEVPDDLPVVPPPIAGVVKSTPAH